MSDILEPYMSNSNPTLEHHGVLGMKWGQHLKKAYVDSYISSSKNNERKIKSFAKQDEILPAFMTKVKSVRISTVDKIMAVKNDSLSDVDYLKVLS